MHCARELEPSRTVSEYLEVPRMGRLVHGEERVQFSSRRVYQHDKLFKLCQKYTEKTLQAEL